MKKHYGHDTYRCNKCQARGKGYAAANKRWGTPIPASESVA